MTAAKTKVAPVTVERTIGENSHKFNFTGTTAEEATKKLDELLAGGQVDIDQLKNELKSYIVKKAPVQKAKAPSAAKPAKEKKEGARGRMESNPLREKILALFDSMTAEKKDQKEILEAAQKKFSITYANAYYYYSRVWNKPKKK